MENTPEPPSFAAEWVQQWKDAGPRLQAIRDEELRQLGNQPKTCSPGVLVYEKYPERYGMVVMQKWFTRGYLLSQFRSIQDE
jgi:hypothetical protein